MIKFLWSKVILRKIRKVIVSDTFKKKLVDAINKEVDISKLSEKKEEQLFRTVIDVLEELIF